MKMKLIYAILAIMLIAFIAWGPIASNVEQAKYTVIQTDDNIEIRDYAPMIVAEVNMAGERKKSIAKGFRLIGAYIFGNNSMDKQVSMTAPVTQQQQSADIAMTAPVMQQEDSSNSKLWKVRFVMPANYTMETLPKPSNNAVELIKMPAKRFAVIGFSGMGSTEALEENAQLLKDYMADKNLKALSKPTYAFFNPPWTLPFLRHNEVMIEVEK